MNKDWDDLSLTQNNNVKKSNRGSLDNMVNPDGSQKFKHRAPAFNLSQKAQSDLIRWHKEWLAQAYRILKPGGVIKAFSATRTYHHLAMAMEQVGFTDLSIEAWTYGSGFPKSLNISKSIDKKLGKERQGGEAATEEAAQFDGYGTALKPSWEPFVVGIKQ